jgi:hypothetical protein
METTRQRADASGRMLGAVAPPGGGGTGWGNGETWRYRLSPARRNHPIPTFSPGDAIEFVSAPDVRAQILYMSSSDESVATVGEPVEVVGFGRAVVTVFWVDEATGRQFTDRMPVDSRQHGSYARTAGMGAPARCTVQSATGIAHQINPKFSYERSFPSGHKITAYGPARAAHHAVRLPSGETKTVRAEHFGAGKEHRMMLTCPHSGEQFVFKEACCSDCAEKKKPCGGCGGK